MNTKPYYYFANFKMFLSYFDFIEYLEQNKDEFLKIGKKKQNQIALFPSDLNLAATVTIFGDTTILWGGQNCALEEEGAFTGQTSAQSLTELGATYCIVGHSEVRKETKRTDTDFAHQAGTLLDHMISPIFCIGESAEEMKTGKTTQKLTTQLTPLFSMLKKNPELGKETPIFIAYEPVWAIGSELIPNNQQLSTIFQWLSNEASKNLKGYDYKLIYGGSVNSSSSAELKKITQIDGFLIGKATLDFQEFKKIVD